MYPALHLFPLITMLFSMSMGRQCKIVEIFLLFFPPENTFKIVNSKNKTLSCCPSPIQKERQLLSCNKRLLSSFEQGSDVM